ncbi:MAG: DUF3461 family protein [Oceanospirillaceae bacterium]|nr:DUF3461 family protein [Oceanospirillaceae bacterium]
MSDYPTLEEMGISSFDEITQYSLRRERDSDVLKIYYKRPKGSLRSRSKKFTFAHPRKTIPLAFRGMAEYRDLKDSSPTLLKAVDELNRLTAPALVPSSQDLKSQFLKELDHLEKVMNAKIDELRRQIKAIK